MNFFKYIFLIFRVLTIWGWIIPMWKIWGKIILGVIWFLYCYGGEKSSGELIWGVNNPPSLCDISTIEHEHLYMHHLYMLYIIINIFLYYNELTVSESNVSIHVKHNKIFTNSSSYCMYYYHNNCHSTLSHKRILITVDNEVISKAVVTLYIISVLIN